MVELYVGISLTNDELHLAKHGINACVDLPKVRIVKILNFDDNETRGYKIMLGYIKLLGWG